MHARLCERQLACIIFAANFNCLQNLACQLAKCRGSEQTLKHK
jgi:hypothetical protein